MRHSVPIILAGVLALTSVNRAADNDSLGAKIDGFVKAEMDRQHVPGVAIAVVKDGQVLKIEGYGLANVEHQVPVTPETIFQSGSLGKQFTAAGIMLLVQDGNLALADPITKFFPDAPATWQPITIRHLLTHTSGIPDYTDSTFDYRRDYTEDELAHMAYALKLEFPAGARWNYSNTGYVLLGIVMHKLTGQFYGDLLTERVFKPAGMKTTRVISEEDIIPHRAGGYRWVDGALKNQEWVSPRLNTTADGSLYFSVRDLLAWDAVVTSRRVLSDDSWKQVFTPVRLNSGRTYPYGFGWGVSERAGRPLHEHGGSWQGFKTQYSRFVGDKLSVIVLANLAQADPAVLADGIAAIVNPALARRPPRPITDSDPPVTERVRRLIEQTRAGNLSPEDFAYVRAGFFPDAPKRYAKMLAEAGALQKLELLDRSERGDDRLYLYRLTFNDRTLLLAISIAPDDRLAQFSLARE
ncbi:MAG: serine hydrolase domain-containing protein [Acidobacteriota bacterium]